MNLISVHLKKLLVQHPSKTPCYVKTSLDRQADRFRAKLARPDRHPLLRSLDQVGSPWAMAGIGVACLAALCAAQPLCGMQPEKDLEMSLHQAAEDINVARCEELIRAGANIDEKKMTRLTSLLKIAIENHAKAKMLGYSNTKVCLKEITADDVVAKMCCRLIIANPNTLNPNSLICCDRIPFIPLGIACHKNNLEVVKTFLTTPLQSEYKKFKAARCGLIAIRYAQPKLNRDMRLFIDQTIINNFANDHLNRIEKMLASTARAQRVEFNMNKCYMQKNQELAQLLDLNNTESYKLILNDIKILIRSLLIPKPRATTELTKNPKE